MCGACEDQDLIAAAWMASTGQMEQGPMLVVADRQFGFMVGYVDSLPGPSPTLARAYPRADAALRDAGASRYAHSSPGRHCTGRTLPIARETTQPWTSAPRRWSPRLAPRSHRSGWFSLGGRGRCWCRARGV